MDTQYILIPRTSGDKGLELSLVVPVFNEAETVGLFLNRVTQVFHNSPISLEIIFVNDGSTDETLQELVKIQQKDKRLKILDLSRNFGKEAALTAGLEAAKGQAIVPIDVDLQDPPELILEMIEKWREGYEVVLARRVNRDSDTWLKRCTASWFYRIHNKIAEPTIPHNVGDFRLVDRSVVEAIKNLPESRRFMKGLFAWVGFETAYVDYERPKRAAGSTKFNGWRLWNLAIEGATSFSTAPLRIWTYVGFFVSFLSFSYALVIATRVLFFGRDLPGFASIIIAVTFLGGIQLIGIGVLGEYLGRAYIESKRRPVFLVRKTYVHKE